MKPHAGSTVWAVLIATLVTAASALVPARQENVLHTFASSPDGAYPFGGLVSDRSGNLYGATAQGGTFQNGMVYELVRPTTSGGAWTETALYSFGTNSSDGAEPEASLVFDAKGNLYGTAVHGGTLGGGTVFELSPPAVSGDLWTETTLYSFPSIDSRWSTPCGLLWVKGVRLYGFTILGGTGYGSIFQLTPPATSGGAWEEETIYSFSGGIDGAYPGFSCSPPAADSSGNLYGTTHQGGADSFGTVFELSPPATSGGTWTETVLHSFVSNNTDGYYPEGGVTFDASGNMYGTTFAGGSHAQSGTVFELTPSTGGSWTETILYNFGTTSHDGVGPFPGVYFDRSGNMYGTTIGGKGSVGMVWKLAPPAVSGGTWTETILYGFKGNADGGTPTSGVILGPSGSLFGTAESAGLSNFGVIYEIMPPGF